MPVCSQFSKESRQEMVQRSCNIQLQTSVEKSDVRTSDARPRGPIREMVGFGEVRSKVFHRVSGLKGLLFLPAHICLGDPLDQQQLENAAITSSVN